MSIELKIFCGEDEGTFIFVVGDDGTVSVEGEEFETMLSMAELGFEKSNSVSAHNFFKNKPFLLLLGHSDNLVTPEDLLMVAITMVEARQGMFFGLYPDAQEDIKTYKDIVRHEIYKGIVRSKGRTERHIRGDRLRIRPLEPEELAPSHMKVHPWEIDGEEMSQRKKFITFALWVLRDMAEAVVGSVRDHLSDRELSSERFANFLDDVASAEFEEVCDGFIDASYECSVERLKKEVTTEAIKLIERIIERKKSRQ